MDYAYQAVLPSKIGERFIISEWNNLPESLRLTHGRKGIGPVTRDSDPKYLVVDTLTNRSAIVKSALGRLRHIGWFIMESLGDIEILMTLDEAIRIRQEIIDRKAANGIPIDPITVPGPKSVTHRTYYTYDEIRAREGVFKSTRDPLGIKFASNGTGTILSYVDFAPNRTIEPPPPPASLNLTPTFYNTGEQMPQYVLDAFPTQRRHGGVPVLPQPAATTRPERELLTWAQVGQQEGVYLATLDPFKVPFASDGKGTVHTFVFRSPQGPGFEWKPAGKALTDAVYYRTWDAIPAEVRAGFPQPEPAKPSPTQPFTLSQVMNTPGVFKLRDGGCAAGNRFVSNGRGPVTRYLNSGRRSGSNVGAFSADLFLFVPDQTPAEIEARANELAAV